MSHKLLVSGYIREQEKSVIKKHIPSEITSLCIEYYHSNSKLLLITNDAIFITDVNEDEETKEDNIVWNASLSKIPSSNYIRNNTSSSYFSKSPSQVNAIENSGICCYSNIALPKYVLSHSKLTGNHNNNVIFKTGGTYYGGPLKDCNAFIFNEADFMTIKTKGIFFLTL